MTAPAWALALVATVCADADVRAPRLAWRRRAGTSSTGVTRRRDGIVAVRAGTDELDQRLTLLHELAHWLSPAPRRQRGARSHHGRAFYDIAFELYDATDSRRRRAAPRVRPLSQLAAPRRRAGSARRAVRPGRAPVRDPRAPAATLASPRPGAPQSGSSATADGRCARPAGSGWSAINLARIAPSAATGAPRPDDGAT